MKVLRIGIASLDEMQARTREILSGKRKRRTDEPQLWFSSERALFTVLSRENRRLLELPDDPDVQALAALQPSDTGGPAGFDAWFAAELTRRRDERKTAALNSLVDRPLPRLALTTVDGKPYKTSSLQGKVILLNFFASW